MSSRWKYAKCTCKQCGRTFEASRYDAKFCGQNCRKAHSRKRENADKDGKTLFYSLQRYAQLRSDDDLRGVVEGWLIQIKEMIPQLEM
jgi:hypothetical protein